MTSRMIEVPLVSEEPDEYVADEPPFMPSSDPRWLEISQPVAQSLAAGPKTGKELKHQFRGRLSASRVLDIVSWLSLNGRARFDATTKRWFLTEVGRRRLAGDVNG